jgi:hypothetical protein
MEEVEHKIDVLAGVKEALESKNSEYLSSLSNQTLHSVSIHQDDASIITAVLVYSLSKLIERKDYERISSWKKLETKLLLIFTEAIKAASENDEEEYDSLLQNARESLESCSIDLKEYIKEIMRKASINKASRVYEHGLSLGKTAELLGITTWELAEYTGSKNQDIKYTRTLNEKARAKMALDFLGGEK